MQRRKNRRRKSVASQDKAVRRSAIELLEARQYLTANGYVQVPLAADQSGAALLQDSSLQNAWGVAIAPGGGPVWVADNASNVASRYSGAVAASVGAPVSVFSLSSSVGVPDNSPTAIVFNQTGDFTVGTGTNASHVLFFIASQNGAIDGWGAGNQAQNAVTVSGAEFTGLAVANNGTASFLYAADFHNGKIDVFNSSLTQTTLSATAFTDSTLPAGYAPYNIQLISGQLYVSYAKQDANKQNPVAGTGNGVIDIYGLDGTFVKELVSQSSLNVPYGMAMAPATFGDFAGDLLVANNGDGHILAYNSSGGLDGKLNLGPGNSSPITISGVRGLTFGNASSAGNSTTLFYSAASGVHGQFGEIVNAFQQSLVAVPTTVSGAQGQSLSGTLAALSDSSSSLTAGNFTVTINWGDQQTSSGSVTSNGNGGFNISGTHTYLTAGSRQVTITASDGTNSITTTATANVTDPSFSPSGMTFTATEGQSFSGQVGSFSDPTGPGNYIATINWGDGTTSSVGTISPVSGGGFNVTGSHTYTSVGSFTAAVVVSEQTSATVTTAIGTINSTASVSDPNTLTATASTFAATEGQSTNATVATFTDSNSAATASLFTASINWGDGTTASAGNVTRGGNGVFTVTGSHAFAENGTLTATVTISDTPGTMTATATSIADVADGNTFTAQPMTVVTNAGQTFAGNVATFSDTNTLVRAADFTATINWGDSTSSAGTVTAANGVVTVSGTHSYASGGTSDPVSVVITEKSPGTASATATSTAIVAAGNFTATGATITATASSASSPQTVASFTPNSGNTDTFTATIDWGDGSSFATATVTAAGGGSFNVVGSHTYATPGNFAPHVIVYQSAGTATATPAEVITARANVASPLVLSPATITAKDHTSSTLTVATFTDANAGLPASDFTATINWGDGTSASVGSVTLNGGVYTVTGIHTFAEAGTLDVSVTIAESAPTVFSTSATATATVSQDDTFTPVAASLTTTVGSTFSGSVATFTDTDTQTSANQLTAVINWGDGSVTAGTVTGSGGQFAVSGNHTYTKDGAFPMTVTIENSSSFPGQTESTATGSALASPGAALTATATTIAPSEGHTFSGTVATFADTGSSNPATAFTATINWGDGTSSTGTVSGASGSYTVAGSHNYADGGSFQVTVDVVETAVSATVSAVSTATVSDTDTLTATNMTVPATAGTTFTGAVAGFTDSNTSASGSDFTA
ncbi:MAG TPA: TIGR03118 family protein, partial [Pirellulales bacterium]|nr:TIGR03118 family protein [Pirellulales bacterium]